MDIVIVGAGKMGEELCRSLCAEGHNITLIEKNPDRLQLILETYDITGVLGNGSFYEIQSRANVDKCDIFIAVTEQDEMNIISCVIANRIGAKYTVARIRTPEYAEHLDFTSKNLGISLMVNPEREAAREIFRTLQFPTALSVESFAHGQVNMVELLVKENRPMIGMNMIAFRKRFPGLITAIIQENDQSVIPSGETTFRAGQHFYVLGEHKDLRNLYAEFGGLSRIKSVLIVGGGRIARYVLDMHRKTSKHIKLIEANELIANDLAEEFPNFEIILGDGTDQALLKEENIHQYDCLVAMTGIDEENIILSMFAASEGVPRTITKVNRLALLPIAFSVGVQSMITPVNLGATAIIRYVRSIDNASQSSNIEALYRVRSSSVEIMQCFARPTFHAIDIPLSEVKFRDGVLIALIVRDHKIIIPSGQDAIQVGDHVLVVSNHGVANELNGFLRGEG